MFCETLSNRTPATAALPCDSNHAKHNFSTCLSHGVITRCRRHRDSAAATRSRVVSLVSHRASRPQSSPGALKGLDEIRRIDAGCEQLDALFRETPKQIPAGLIDRGDVPQE